MTPVNQSTDTTAPPLSEKLLDEIVKGNKLQSSFLEASRRELTQSDWESLETYLEYALDSGLTLEYLALSYNTVVLDIVREQVYFLRNGKYRYSKYEEVASSVYHNPDYMGRYMHGVAITLYLWPNHLNMRRFFVDTLPRDRTGSYLEVGPGHGMFMMTGMRIGSFSEYVGLDISATSVAITRSVLEHPLYATGKNYRLEQGDFLGTSVTGTYDALVIGEVLEHVEEPLPFLEKARTLVPPGGYFYMSTAVNGPVIDHIYLFRTVGEVDDMIKAAGFTIDNCIIEPHLGTSLEEAEERRLPISVAYALS
jgi:2-polyprenyl-3-methyl-5-hydroxy-6-metoxy-1,4-benzoquinol methylase